MFNPLAPLTQKALDAFIKDGKKYFVRQTFNRARDHFDEGIKGYYLFCHYDDYLLAKAHFDALAHDPKRYLYDWDKPEDQEKLKVAASKPPGYKIYTNTFIPDWEKHITDRIKGKIRAYINKLGWKPTREEGITPVFYPHFGEVHVTLKFRGREVSVNFEEIENTI